MFLIWQIENVGNDRSVEVRSTKQSTTSILSGTKINNVLYFQFGWFYDNSILSGTKISNITLYLIFQFTITLLYNTTYQLIRKVFST